MESTILWILLAIGALLVEISTVALVSLWFVIGALVALAASVLGAELWIQVLLFALVSLFMLLLVRPFLRHYVNPHKVRTNVDALVGLEAVVTEDISNLNGIGAIKVNGLVWSARSENGESIPAGEIVTICSVEGVKAIVCRNAALQP